MKKIKLLSIIGFIVFVFLTLNLFSKEAMAAPQTLTIFGAQGTPGETDPYTEFSLDDGLTWNYAYLYGDHPWGFVSGTNSWINCGPSGTAFCTDRSVLYRIRFNVPEGFINPQMTFDIKADNYADIWLNGTYVMHVVGAGGTSGDATVNTAVYSGLNEIKLLFTDEGGWSGINYKITLDVDAPTPPTLIADNIAPTTTNDASANWVNQDVTVNLTATDNPNGSGVTATNYILDGGAQQMGTSVSLTAEGVHTIAYWSVDNAGNVEAQHSATIKIDKTAPTTADNAPIGWVNSVVTVTLSVYDGGSGVTTTNYTIDGGVPQDGTSVSLTAEGVHTIAYWSVDNAGNVEAIHSKIVKVELLPMGSNGQFHIDDIVKLINQGTLQQKDMNGDGVFDFKDIKIMLYAVTSILFPLN